jgi:hypothetical protein
VLHHGVKRALAVVRSRFVYDMDLITDGFITDPYWTDKENEPKLLRSLGVASPSSSKSRWFRLLMTRACEPNLGMKVRVIS